MYTHTAFVLCNPTYAMKPNLPSSCLSIPAVRCSIPFSLRHRPPPRHHYSTLQHRYINKTTALRSIRPHQFLINNCQHRHLSTHLQSSPSSSSNIHSHRCWNCNQTASPTVSYAANIFCSACHTLQPPPENDSSLNVYDLFHTVPSFAVDRKGLESTYRQYQRQLHPDRFTQQSTQLQQYSADWSSLINSAYSTLCDSYSRAIYVLAANGVEWEKQPSTLTSNMDLMEVMELREEIDSAGMSKDWNKLDELQSSNDAKMHSIERQLQDSTNLGKDGLRLTDNEIQTALPLVAKLSYCKQIADAIHQHLPSR